MRYVRKLVYKLGFRPKPFTPFYSPSLHLIYAHKDGMLKRYNPDDGKYY